mmetsp:Transcript_20171/g.64182  ORF Transcript_20171/g.64182 Transcript_20171/m.64182 type:complete len:242 (-) Transcript_20171:21-746(-)
MMSMSIGSASWGGRTKSRAAVPARGLPRGQRVQARASPYTLYTHPMSRGKIVEWYIAELGIQDLVEFKYVNMEEREHKEPWFTSEVNPFGMLPCLSSEGVSIFESGAILQYLAEKHAGGGSAEERAELAKWVLFANSTMGNAIFIDDRREKQMPPIMDALDQYVGGRDFLVGNEFSAADVAVGSYLLYVPLFFPDIDLGRWPRAKAYLDGLAGRPAYQATLGERIAKMPPPPGRATKNQQA